MFVVDTNLSYVDLSDKKLLSVLRSSNQPLIAAADRPAEPTEAFICSYENKTGQIETRIMLHLLKSGIRVFYSSERGEFAANEFSEVEIDALEFLESMGFMMDNIGFQKMEETKRDELFGGLPVFVNPEKFEEKESKEEEEFVSAAELAESLEEVFSDSDLGELEKREVSQEPVDLMKDLEKDLGEEEMEIPSEHTKADPLTPSGEPVPVAKESQGSKSIEGVDKIARIISSF